MQQSETIRYLRTPQLLALTGLSKSTIWRMERRGSFPKKRQISQNCVGWLESEIQAWLISRELAGATNNKNSKIKNNIRRGKS